MRRKRPPTLLAAMAFALLGLAAPQARAQPITFSYNWMPNGQQKALVLASDGNAGTTPVPGGGTGGITFTNQPPGTVTGSHDVTATQLTTFSDADPSTPDHFTNKAYSLTLLLTDPPSHASGTLTFGGSINGTLSASTANLLNTFTGPTTQTLTLGSDQYTATIGPYTPPGPPNGAAGSIGALLSAQPLASPKPPAGGGTGGGSPPGTAGGGTGAPPPGSGGQGSGSAPSAAPEPSTLLLAGLGLSYLGLASWRRGRR